jgi:hypothetical protein
MCCSDRLNPPRKADIQPTGKVSYSRKQLKEAAAAFVDALFGNA